MNRVIGIVAALSCLLNGTFSWAADPPAAAAQTPASAQKETASPAAEKGAEQPAPAAPATSETTTPAKAPAAPEAVRTFDPSARNIRFQFDGIPYMDVLERFAQMSNKPLVADTNVQGSLTFNDPTPYNYQEALDTLNLMLSMKGMSLVDSEHYLRLVPLKELPQMPIRILRGLDKTGDVRPGEVVTVVLHVKNLNAKETSEAVTSMLSNAGSVAPLGHGHGVIVTDRLANIQRIQSLLNLIDTETVAERQMKAYTLLHASGAVVADLINRTFGVATAPKRTQLNAQTKQLDTLPADPNDYVTAVYDDASRTLVLFGPQERVALAEELISKFEDKEGGSAGDVRIYYPQVNKAEDLAQMIRQAIPGVAAPNETAATAATKARLIVDSVQNRLIVAAPIAGQLDSIENLINTVDKPVHGTGGSGLRSQTVQITRVFRPRSSDAASLAKILTEALSKRTPGGAKITTANVTVEPTSQSVVVTGSPGDVQTAVDVITQLENGSGLPMPQETKFIDVGTVAEAKRLVPLIEQIYRSQLNDGLGGQTAHAKIIADEQTGRLIVTASDDHIKRIEAIVQQLKAEKAQPKERRLQILTLAHLRVDAGFTSISNLVSERMSDKRFEDTPKPLLLPDALNNRLLVTATDDQFHEIEQVVKTLDIGPEKGQREMRVIPVQSKSASELIALSTQLINQLGDAQSNPQLAPKLVPDASGRQIIVLATAEDMARVTNLVAQLDGGSTTPRQMRAVELFSRNATDFTPLVQQLYQEQLKNQPDPAGGPATLLPEAKNNRVMVSGSEKEIARVEAIIRQLDPEGKKGAKDETRVIRLKAAVAGDLAGLVEKSLSAQAQQVKVLVDPRSNSLVVTGESGSVEAASQIIQQLDTQSDVQPRELRLIELKSAEASAVAPMVTSLFTDIIRDQRGPDYKPQAKIVADTTGNRLIVTGSKDELRTVSGLVEQLDQMPEAAGQSRVFKLTTADATSLVTVVSNAMVRFDARNRPIRLVSVSADEKSNSLIVSGSRSDLQDAQVIIERLDGEGLERGRTLKVIDVVTDDPDALAAMATKVFAAQNPGRNVNAAVSITPEPSGKRLIILAPASMMPQVQTVIQTLDSKPDQGARELQTVELKSANAQKILPTVRRIYGEQTQGKSVKPATIYPDSSGTRLLVYGTKDQGAAVRQIVDTMVSGTPATPRETRSFDVGRPEDVQRLAPLVQQLYQEQWKEKGDSDPADAQILSDARTGRLIVTGKPEHLKQIEAILKQLNTAKPRADGRDTRIYDLTTANAADLANTVRTLYQEDAKSRLGTLTPDLLILPDASANRLIITGETEEVQAAGAIIEKLDKVTAQSGTVRLFKLKYADPSKVLEILTNALTSFDSYGRAHRRVGVTLDAKTRSIIVAGDPKELQALQNASIIIEQLDSALGQQAERKIKVFTLKQSRVAELSPKVRQLYNDQLSSKPDLASSDVLLLDDAPGNQLIAAGSDAQLALLEQIINQLQAAQIQRGHRETKLIEIGQADEVERLLPLVQQLYRDHWRDKAAGDPPDAQIVPDTRNARFIVTARTNQIAEIESIISQLRSGTAEPQGRETRIYDLTTATAMELSDTVRNLYREQAKGRPNVRVEDTAILPDASANRLIVTAPTNELEQVDQIIKSLDKVSAQSASVRVFKLKYAEPEQIRDILSTAFVTYDAYGRPRKRVNISVDPKSRTIIAAGDPKELQGASVVVEQLDSTLGGQPERRMKVLPVKLGKASDLLTKVRALYDDQVKAQPELAASDVLLLEDRTSNQLIVAGTEKQLQLIESIASQLENSALVLEARETRVYDLTSTAASDLATTVKTLYQEAIKSRPTAPGSQALVLPDANANRLIVSATTNDLELIDAIVQKLDKTELQTGRTRVFKLKSSEAQQVATLLSTSLVQISPNGRSTPRVSVGVDTQNNLLIVSGAPQDLQSAAVIVDQMDQMLAKEPRQLRVVALQSGLATEVANRVKQLYQDQLKGQPKTGPADALIMGDDVSSRLIITASDSHMKLIEDIVAKLQETGAGTGRQLRVLNLQRNSAASVAAMLSQLFARQISTQDPSQHLGVSASGDDRTLVLDAAVPVLEKVEQLVKSLDGEEALGKVEVRTYQMPEGNATELAPTLARLFAERAGQTAPSGLTPRFEADAAANVLIVAAAKDQFVQIDKLVEELKNTARVANEIRTFKLQNGDPTQIAEVLQTMLTDNDPTQPGQPRPRRFQFRPGGGVTPVSDVKVVRVAPARSLNAVVVQGPPEKLALAEKLIQTLDKEEIDGKTVIESVRLKKAHAENVAEAVSKTIASKGGAQTRLQRVSVTPVLGPNSLLLNGPSDAVKEVIQVIHDLDTESEDEEIKVHIYKLENGTAREVSTVIQQLLQNVTRSQMRARAASGGSGTSGAAARFIQPSVSVDERSNSLIVSGTQAHFKMVEQLLSTLDKVPQHSERDVQFVWLRNAKAFDVASKVEAVFAGRPENDRPVIDADIFNNSISVIGKRADIVQVQDLISRLDASSRDTSMQVRLRPLDRVPVEQMARMLQNIYPQMSAGLIKVVEKVQPPASPENTTAAPRNAPDNTPAPSGPTEKKGAEDHSSPEVVVALDKNANALILSGPTHELDQIDHIISELSFSYISSDAEFRVFPLKEADPVVVARTLTELFRPEPVQVQGQQPAQQGQQQRPGEVRVIAQTPKVTAVAEPRTRSVIVRAKPTDFTLMESLIKQLDVAGVSSQLEYRIVSLTNAPPQKIAPLVQQMVTQMNIIRPGEPLSVMPDARSHGLLVVAREALLAQVEAMIHSLDTPAPFAEAEVQVLSLKRASASQLANILQTMLKPGTQGEATADARELQEQIRRLKVKNQDGKEVVLDLSKPIRIMGDPLAGAQGGGNRLILSSTPDNLKALAAVVEMMDAVPVSDGVNVKLVHLQYADAATVSTTLNSIFTQGQRLATGPSGGKAEPEGNTGKALVNPLNVAIDSRSNSLILSGRPESLDLAQKVINDLDRKVDRFITEVRLFRLKHASARRVAPLLQSVFAEGPAVPGTEGLATQVTRLRAVMPEEGTPTTEQPKARAALVIQADDTTNLLIVAARADTLPLIEAVINQLDIPAASGMDNVRVYALDHADPMVIQKIISDLHSGPRASQLRTEDIPNITVDERTQSMIVAGSQKAFAFIDGIIAQLDKELPLELRDVRIIPLENADAGTVAASLQRLLDARVTQKAALGKQEAEAMRVLVIGEPRSNSLLVAGSKDSFELVDSLAHELDAAPPALSGRIRLVPLRYADARALSTSLVNLFNQRYQAARSPDTQRNRPVIIPDPRSNSLLVAAGVDDNQAIDDLVARLDQRLEDPSMVLTVVGLRHNNSASVATTLESIFAARLRSRTVPGQPPSPQDAIKIEPDSLNNSLIISASRENLELIAGLLEKIDVEPVVAEGVVQTFTLEYADAQRVANMLRSLVQQGLYRPGKAGVGEQGPKEAMAVTVDARSNTLVVSASPENLMVIKEVIRQIDNKDFDANGNIRLYALKHARASSLATVLTQFFQARRQGEAGAGTGERSQPVTVVPDDRVNALLVTGGKESFDVIDRMIAQLDGDDVQARMGFRVFVLKQATAAKLQSTLQRLFVNRPPRIKGEPPDPITVVADSWVNALIVGASVDDMAMVASLVERLDNDQSQGVTVQVYPLAKADARRVAQIVQGLYREGGPGGAFPVAVTADERMNAIVVSAGESDLKRIGDLVKKLDTDQVGRVAEIRIFPLQHARADSISTILNTALNARPTTTTDQSPNAASLLQFITRTSDGKEFVASALKEGVLITPDSRMNALVVSAPVDYMNLLEQVVNRLDSSAPQQAKIKVFALVNADARMMAQLIQTLFRIQPSGLPAAGQRAIQYTLVRDKQEAGGLPADDPSARDEVEVASATLGTDEQGALHVTVDERTNSLLVGGTEHYVELVSEIIQSLDSSEAQERKSKVYPLKNAQASDIATAIRTFLDQDRQRITQVLGQEAVGTAQRLLEREVAIVAETNSNTLLLSASPRYFKQVEDLIVSLDQPRPQVLIQVLLAEVTLDSTQDLGVEWNITKTVENAKLATGTDFGVLSDLKNFGGFSSAVTGGDYNFLIRALQNDGRLEVLSRPQILTADNKPATINVGQRVPLINNSTVTPQGGSFSGINYESVGVNLEVTPRIGADGAVRMEISTTNSALSSSTVDVPSGSGTVPIPIINERRASTFVSVQSGQSILIGGLIETSEDNRVKKVPYLGDIPGLGVLFRSKTKISNRKELLILLTPQVLMMGTEKAFVEDIKDMTRDQLQRSTLRDQIQHDKLRDQLLEPLYPEGLKPATKANGNGPTPNNPSGLNTGRSK